MHPTRSRTVPVQHGFAPSDPIVIEEVGTLGPSETMVVDGVSATSSLGLAGSPIAIVSVIGAWMAAGLVTAWMLGRRGHDGRAMGALGLVFGPLLISVALDAVRNRERAGPIVLDPGRPGDGTSHVLIGALGQPAAVSDALPELERMAPTLGRVTVAAMIDFESAERDDWHDAKENAARDLAVASVLLDEYGPELVLLPGRPERALGDHAVEHGYDTVIVTGEGRAVATAYRRLTADGCRAVVVAGTDRQPDH